MFARSGQVLAHNGPAWRLWASHGNIVIALLTESDAKRVNIQSKETRFTIIILSRGLKLQCLKASMNFGKESIFIKDYDVIKLNIFGILGIRWISYCVTDIIRHNSYSAGSVIKTTRMWSHFFGIPWIKLFAARDQVYSWAIDAVSAFWGNRVHELIRWCQCKQSTCNCTC